MGGFGWAALTGAVQAGGALIGVAGAVATALQNEHEEGAKDDDNNNENDNDDNDDDDSENAVVERAGKD
jgi:mannose/fructose/N-acetylgalactosamine-specific phosphotransferase system component IIC